MVQDVSSKSETLLIIASLSSATCVKQRGTFFEDIKLHDENNEVSTKSETSDELSNVSTDPVCEYAKIVGTEATCRTKVGHGEDIHFSLSDMHLAEWPSSREG